MSTDAAPVSDHWRPDTSLIDHALARAHEVLGSDAATEHLASYYAVESNYAGVTFENLEPNEPDLVTPTDLLAVTTLSVDIGPHAIRTFQSEGADLTKALQALGADLRLETIDPVEVAPKMASLYELVKRSLRRAGAEHGNSWVTASKICARKRPNLFPVRDNVVLGFLGLPKNYPDDWPAFQALVADGGLMSRLDEHVRAATTRQGVVSALEPTQRLRHLDVVLWMHARSTAR